MHSSIQNQANFVIKNANISNLDDIVFLENTCFQKDDVFSRSQIKRLLNSNSVYVFLSYKIEIQQNINYDHKITNTTHNNQQLAGYLIGLTRRYKIPSARIYKIGVLPEFRNQKLALFLLFYVENFFIELGMKKIFAEVRKSNIASQNLFLKAGYQKLKEIKFYYKNGETAIKFFKII